MNQDWQALLEEVNKGRKVKVDSRDVYPGDVFVALPGHKADGSAFIPQALERGAKYIVTSQPVKLNNSYSASLICHPDPREGLGELAKAYFKTFKQEYYLVGITGTNGKTTVSYLLEHILIRAGYKIGVIGTVSYRWPGHEQAASLTTPDCLRTHQILSQMAANGVEIVFMEVSSHALDQKRAAGLDFDLALFTNLSQDHLDYHQDMEDYYQAKSKLFLENRHYKPKAVINLDDQYGRRLVRKSHLPVGYSLDSTKLQDIVCLYGTILSASRDGLHLLMEWKESRWEIRSPLIGHYNASNLLSAQATALQLGLEVNDLKSIQDFQGVPGRLEKISNPKGLHVFVDYAHSPDALENVLQDLKRLNFKRIIVVFGCGGDRDRKKRPLMGRAVGKYADLVVLTSDNPRHEKPLAIMEDVLPGLRQEQAKVMLEVDRREAIGLGLSLLQEQDVLLVAGKGHENYQEIGDQRFHYSDVQVIKECIC